MANLQRSPWLPKLLAAVLIYCVCLQDQLANAYSENNSPLTNDERYKNLFVSDVELKEIIHGKQPQDISDITGVLFQHPIDTDFSHENEGHPGISKRSSCRQVDPCCKTSWRVTVPAKVTVVYTGKTYPVVHSKRGFQIVHEGVCAKRGCPCTYLGRCQVRYRMQWLLVGNSPTNFRFLPVRIPNHCYCQYH